MATAIQGKEWKREAWLPVRTGVKASAEKQRRSKGGKQGLAIWGRGTGHMEGRLAGWGVGAWAWGMEKWKSKSPAINSKRLVPHGPEQGSPQCVRCLSGSELFIRVY